jgi:hypothetical protein
MRIVQIQMADKDRSAQTNKRRIKLIMLFTSDLQMLKSVRN